MSVYLVGTCLRSNDGLINHSAVPVANRSASLRRGEQPGRSDAPVQRCNPHPRSGASPHHCLHAASSCHWTRHERPSRTNQHDSAALSAVVEAILGEAPPAGSRTRRRALLLQRVQGLHRQDRSRAVLKVRRHR